MKKKTFYGPCEQTSLLLFYCNTRTEMDQ